MGTQFIVQIHINGFSIPVKCKRTVLRHELSGEWGRFRRAGVRRTIVMLLAAA